jgi:hypothetical protein
LITLSVSTLSGLGAIQIICDTLGGRWGGGVSKNVTWQFLLVISLVKVDKTCNMGGGGSQKCGKSVTYYLNGPLHCCTIVKMNGLIILKLRYPKRVGCIRSG